MFKTTLRQHLEKFFPDRELARWFDPLDMDVDEGKKVLRVFFPHTFFGRWFMGSMKQDFEKEVLSLIQGIQIEYNKNRHSGQIFVSSPSVQSSSVLYRFKDHLKKTSGKLSEKEHTIPEGLPLLSEYTFDNFIVNRKNDFPLAAAKEAVNASHSSSYLLFILYGQSGTGKSHLLGAMANTLKSKDNAIYYGGIEFLESFFHYSKGYTQLPVKAALIDDAHRVSASPALQDNLTSLIDLCHSTKRLLVLTLDMHPSHCPNLHPKLRSRLNSGLVVELKRPDLDIRTQYIQQKNRLYELDLNKETILSLAQRYPDLRSIDGFLAHLRLYNSMLAKQPKENGISRSSIPDPTSLLNQDATYSFLSPTHILHSTARHFSVSPEEIVGKSRDKNITLARHIAILLCRELLGLSLVQVGRFFGGRDHSSILYSIKKIKQLQDRNKEVHNQVEILRKLCLSRS